MTSKKKSKRNNILANLGTTAYYQPVTFYGNDIIASKPSVKQLFKTIKDNNEELVVTFRNDPMVYSAFVDKPFDDFVLLKTKRIVDGEELYIHNTIPYSDVLSREVKIEGREGKLEAWEKRVPVPEKKMLKILLGI